MKTMRVIYKKDSALFAMTFLFFFGASRFFSSSYVTHDTLHYMHLGIEPIYGDSHPLVFGYILRFFNFLGQLIDVEGAGLRFFLLYQQIVGAALLSFFTLRTLRSTGRTTQILGGGVILIPLLIPAVLHLTSAVWTEITFMGLSTVLLILSIRILSRPKLQLIHVAFLGFGFCLLYNLRYQGLVLPIAFFLAYLLTRTRWDKVQLGRTFGVLALLTMTFILPTAILKATLRQPVDLRSLAAKTPQLSMRCVLKCHSRTLTEFCSSDENRQALERTGCSDLLIRKVVFDWPNYHSSLLTALAKEGPVNIATWLLLAPISYLLDQHTAWGLEIGPRRLADQESSAVYPKAYEFYQGQFETPTDIVPPQTQRLRDYLWFVHFDLRGYAIGFVTTFGMASLWAFLRPRHRGSVAYLFTLGTLLLFSYVVPHTPFRFLVQLGFGALLSLNEYATGKGDNEALR